MTRCYILIFWRSLVIKKEKGWVSMSDVLLMWTRESLRHVLQKIKQFYSIELPSFPPHPRPLFHCFQREGEESIERNMDVREKHRSVTFRTCPDWGLYEPGLGIEPTSLQLWDHAPTNWRVVARAAELLAGPFHWSWRCLSTRRTPHWSPG